MGLTTGDAITICGLLATIIVAVIKFVPSRKANCGGRLCRLVLSDQEHRCELRLARLEESVKRLVEFLKRDRGNGGKKSC